VVAGFLQIRGSRNLSIKPKWEIQFDDLGLRCHPKVDKSFVSLAKWTIREIDEKPIPQFVHKVITGIYCLKIAAGLKL
jgi:hypothetical protein